VGGVGVVERERPRPRERDERREGASWARLVAPVAFFAAATTLILIVHNSLQARPEEPQPQATPTTPTATGSRAGGGTQTTTTTPARRRRFHRVQSGDTLESIAARYDTTVEDLQELNPAIDPLALSPGQRIRIR
jgi:Tfp pilus assembly protein FimV